MQLILQVDTIQKAGKISDRVVSPEGVTTILQGQVVQSIVSLMRSLRGQLIQSFTTLLSNILIFFVEKM